MSGTIGDVENDLGFVESEIEECETNLIRLVSERDALKAELIALLEISWEGAE